MEWFNPPLSSEIDYSQEEGCIMSISSLRVHADPRTDYWRKTHYGFIRDNGHFLYCNATGNFEMSVSVEGKYASLYDQGGLMIRQSPEYWVKAGIEYVNNIANISAVVTRDYSDWSVINLNNFDARQTVHFKLVMKEKSFEIFYSLDGEKFSMYRVGFLSDSDNFQVGIMCAAPDSETGFDIEFKNFKLKPI
ncbi:unnamed protein product [Blepharisma stoltei]|uniref:DUF1349 domain-containing protein n=1 Tax=Blepharisma stoltei TaxID=1481888 RepID=A0AAU9IUU6_9CILI|nr:unnamed protein product [Blepharisma stoltei]